MAKLITAAFVILSAVIPGRSWDNPYLDNINQPTNTNPLYQNRLDQKPLFPNSRLPQPQERIGVLPDGTYQYRKSYETPHYNPYDNKFTFESPKARLRILPDGTYQWAE